MRVEGFLIETGILPGLDNRKNRLGEEYHPEYKRGYLSAHRRAPSLTNAQRHKEKDRPGRTYFVDGWRDYFREHF